MGDFYPDYFLHLCLVQRVLSVLDKKGKKSVTKPLRKNALESFTSTPGLFNEQTMIQAKNRLVFPW